MLNDRGSAPRVPSDWNHWTRRDRAGVTRSIRPERERWVHLLFHARGAAPPSTRVTVPPTERFTMTTDQSGNHGNISVLPEDECRTLLSTTTVGRIAFVNEDGQQLVPVNFAFIDGTIYFRTLSDGFLAQLARNHDDVAFGVDHHADNYRHGWNVTVKGSVSEVEDRATINMVLAHARLRPWAGGVRPMVLEVNINSIAGRRVSDH